MDSKEAAKEIIDQVDGKISDDEAIESIAKPSVAVEDWQNYKKSFMTNSFFKTIWPRITNSLDQIIIWNI